MTRLPESWRWSTIGATCSDISYGFTTSASLIGTRAKLLRITDIQNGSVDWGLVPRCSETPVQTFHLRAGDLVIARTGATVGKSFLILDIPEPAVFASYLIRLRFHLGLHPIFAQAFCRSAYYWEQIQVFSKGTAQPGANASILSGVKLPVPPFAEQRRIVAKIDRLSARSKRARDELQRHTDLIRRLRSACLSQGFCAGASDSSHQFVGAICERVTKGSSPKWQGFDYQDDGILFVRSQNIGNGCLVFEQKVYLEKSFNDNSKNSVIQLNDVCLNIVGASIGRTAVATSEIVGANCNQAVAILRLITPSFADAKYLMLWLSTAFVQSSIVEGSVDVARANFSLDAIKRLPVPWPAAHTRKEIVRRIEHAFAAIDRLAAEARSARALLDTLDQAILAKAFRGELVPQDPDDEPASVLLERIRAERAAALPKPRGRRKA